MDKAHIRLSTKDLHSVKIDIKGGIGEMIGLLYHLVKKEPEFLTIFQAIIDLNKKL